MSDLLKILVWLIQLSGVFAFFSFVFAIFIAWLDPASDLYKGSLQAALISIGILIYLILTATIFAIIQKNKESS
ncbi:hypothetical protein MOW14_14860 (plasmid) [Acinetobacter indicus]|uniref:hypothetical protein n=1 Tax=Acinetobacter indicus TaxID=756892 RepID=UPI001FA7465C|nr:hypothetical protein [Acinetobacter indicus]UNW11109.1 hypothetical protein MOW14_14860 [Acinetobacter indicus]